MFYINNDQLIYEFLDCDLTLLFEQQPGHYITSSIEGVLANMNTTYCNDNGNCIKILFYLGELYFRKTPPCQVQNVMLLIFSAIIMATKLRDLDAQKKRTQMLIVP